MKTIKQLMINLGTLCAAVLVLMLALFIGDGRPLSGWALWYLAALASASLAGLYARISR